MHSIASTSHVFTLSFCDLLHGGRIRIHCLFVVSTCVSKGIGQGVSFGEFIDRVVHPCLEPTSLGSRVLIGGRELILLLFFRGECDFVFSGGPIAQVHVLLELEKLFHFGFALYCSDVLSQFNLQML